MTFSALAAGALPHHGKYSSRQGVQVAYMIVHHWAGTAGGDSRLTNPSQEVSATYVLYSSGALLGQVPEEYRPWTSGSWNADAPAVTIETQNVAVGGDWPVSDASLETLARLAADLCVRYGWVRLDRGRVRGHREFYATACPGPYLWARLDWIVARGNQILDGDVPQPEAPAPKPEPKPNEEDEMYRPTVHYRTEGAFEATRAHPLIGADLEQYTGPGWGEKHSRLSADGKVRTFRGFEVTADEATWVAWSRTHCLGRGNVTSQTGREDYIAIQVEASRIATEIQATERADKV